ncbi:hypothetical protein BKA82DRAFT_1004852 [Pisolithus tinctorius]|uniref:Uncharacterized protein n=1 Tax=Pisolithus tinctorius Marx 270 TaxID=870435 RepID=A0A0C3IQD9_PISTI|nr:hypothetical protein BKA82DRAFT_1004852 [Pisolithus tinctorius]KIN93069.1 hypothetical protein M404DRAFT_1009210 [Pisolithus tinctorius Marx 270]KIN99172.1 hypothetical protein M404DRAFT_1004852 [Pisolithus tinctorius Marx 270]
MKTTELWASVAVVAVHVAFACSPLLVSSSPFHCLSFPKPLSADVLYFPLGGF